MAMTIDPINVVPTPTTVEAAALEEAARYFRRAGHYTAAVIQLATGAPRPLTYPRLGQLSQLLLASAALCDELRQPAPTGRPAPSLPDAGSERG